MSQTLMSASSFHLYSCGEQALSCLWALHRVIFCNRPYTMVKFLTNFSLFVGFSFSMKLLDIEPKTFQFVLHAIITAFFYVDPKYSARDIVITSVTFNQSNCHDLKVVIFVKICSFHSLSFHCLLLFCHLLFISPNGNFIYMLAHMLTF